MGDKKYTPFMAEALKEAEIALNNGEFPVGCVIADDSRIICRGSRAGSLMSHETEHAEIVALRELNTIHPSMKRSHLTIYSTMEPCLMCFSTLILNNIRTIVYGFEDVMGGGTTLDLLSLRPLYRDMEVTIKSHVLRRECLQIFKEYFKNGENRYLQDTLLAQYTISQEL